MGYEKNIKQFQKDITAVCEGENQTHTALAKTFGLPLAIAALLILNK